MRICSKSVQSERDETVCVLPDSTKKGADRSAPSSLTLEKNTAGCLALRLLTAARSCTGTCSRRGSAGFAFLGYRFCWSIQRPAILSFRRRSRFRCRRDRRILNQSPFALANESQLFVFAIPIDLDQVSQPNLFGCKQIRQWINNVPLNRPLQVACAIALIRAF